MNIVDIYFNGLKKYVSILNSSEINHVGIHFKIHDRDTHVVDRAIQRKIDIIELLRTSKNIIDRQICLIVYYVHLGKTQFVIQTNHGNLVFRVTKSTERNGFIIRLCTITSVGYRHDRDVMIGEN